jgi:hypothetical protein
MAAPRNELSHPRPVTTKQRLHQLVYGPAAEQADRALVLLEAVAASSVKTGRRQVVPSSLGVGASGRNDVSQRVDELLAEGFGADPDRSSSTDRRLGGADASIIAVCERLGVETVATLNRRDFDNVRPLHRQALVVAPD